MIELDSVLGNFSTSPIVLPFLPVYRDFADSKHRIAGKENLLK